MFSNRFDDLLKALSIDAAMLGDASVLVLPENVGNLPAGEELKDTDEGIHLAKHLKSEGVGCKTAYDFGIRPKVIERRGVDVWLGVIWIIDFAVLPIFVNLLSAWIQGRYLKSLSGSDSSTFTEPPKMHLKLNVKSGKDVTSIDFDGSAEDFAAILPGLKALKKPAK